MTNEHPKKGHKTQSLKRYLQDEHYWHSVKEMRREARDDIFRALKYGLVAAVFIVGLITCMNTKAEPLNVKVQAIASIGVYHRIDRYTHPKLLDETYGSSTPATLKFGFRFSDCAHWACVGAENIDVVYHHQSYLDRGKPFNDGQETYIDMIGVEFTWALKEWRL